MSDNNSLQLPVHLSARADQLRAEALTLREHLPLLADWYQRARDLIGEVSCTGLWNDENGDLVPAKAEALGMAEINDMYCDLEDGVRLRHNAHGSA